MSGRPGFLLDENIDPSVADGLRQHELEARSARELDLLSASDHDILERAISLGSILVTRDARDFILLARVYTERGASLPGILLVPPSLPQGSPGALIDAILRWNEARGPADEIAGGVAWLAPADREDGDRQVKEARPAYMRALDRIGATIGTLH